MLGRRELRRRLQVGATPAETIFDEGSIRVLRYGGREAGAGEGPPVVIIPSLINRHYILDLLPGRSLVEFLLARGLRVYLLEWKPPEDEDRFLSFDRLVAGRVRRAVRAALRHDGADHARLVGHCLGGTLALALGLRYPELVSSLTLITAPVDFDRGGQLTTWSRSGALDLEALLEAYGNMPWPLMQAAFQLLKPASWSARYLHAMEKITQPAFARNFLALELWSSDGVSFPGGCYRSIIQALYRDNDLARGRARVAGRPIRLAELGFPVLSITSDGDHIAPPECTLSASHLGAPASGNLTCWKVKGGHIGCLLSRKAQASLWPRLAEWLLAPVEVAA